MGGMCHKPPIPVLKMVFRFQKRGFGDCMSINCKAGFFMMSLMCRKVTFNLMYLHHQ